MIRILKRKVTNMPEARLGEIELYDGLDSNSALYALTAKQGKILNEKIENFITNNKASDSDIDAIFN